MDVAAIREGINTALIGLGYTPYPYSLGDVDPPAFVIGLPQEANYGASLNLDQLTMPVTIFVSLADAQDAVARMDAALSTGNQESVKDALSRARSNAWRGQLRVPAVTDVGPVEVGNQRLIGAVFRCELLA